MSTILGCNRTGYRLRASLIRNTRQASLTVLTIIERIYEGKKCFGRVGRCLDRRCCCSQTSCRISSPSQASLAGISVHTHTHTHTLARTTHTHTHTHTNTNTHTHTHPVGGFGLSIGARPHPHPRSVHASESSEILLSSCVPQGACRKHAPPQARTHACEQAHARTQTYASKRICSRRG